MFLILLLSSFVFALEVCLDFSSKTEDPFVNKLIVSKIESFALESGLKLSCSEGSLKIPVSFSFSERPLSISSRQRVSSYILSLSLNIGSENFSASVPYSLPSGAFAELPRRKAVDELLSRLKLPILKYFSEIYRGKRAP
ncbi:MAG: hypothetical protein GXO04_05690 [Aquificae bacterium]|nr:hypothetical protein [Aquificota bacterium]